MIAMSIEQAHIEQIGTSIRVKRYCILAPSQYEKETTIYANMKSKAKAADLLLNVCMHCNL